MNSAHPDRKQKIKHELLEMTWIFLYLAFFFCALTAYDMFLLRQYQVEFWNYTFAIVNALVITKVIMIGSMPNWASGMRRSRYLCLLSGRPLCLACWCLCFM
jgi:hypothetical protein